MASALFRRAGNALKEYAWKLTYDYKMATKESLQDAWSHKFRTSLAVGAVTGLVYSIRTNPSETDLQNQLAEYRQQLALLGDPIRNENVAIAIGDTTKLANERRLWRLNLIFFSLLLRTDDSDRSALYVTQCKPLKPGIREWFERIEDVGAFGKWHFVEKNMIDFDVNPNEWIAAQ